MKRWLVIVQMTGAALLLAGCVTTKTWQQTLGERLPAYGHRNWIVVADSAYPKQSAQGIETIYTDAGQLEVLAEVLRAVESASHVQGIVMLDAELDSVSEEDAPGIEAYRTQLKKMLEVNCFKLIGCNQRDFLTLIQFGDYNIELFNVLFDRVLF